MRIEIALGLTLFGVSAVADGASARPGDLVDIGVPWTRSTVTRETGDRQALRRVLREARAERSELAFNRLDVHVRQAARHERVERERERERMNRHR